MDENERKEMVFYYESRQNPNGDPGFENQPRLMSDNRIMVTDVRIKRTIRDYAKYHHNTKIFVDTIDGKPVKPEEMAQKILNGKMEYKNLLRDTFDVPIFGVLVPTAGKKTQRSAQNADQEETSGSSFKVTGPVQFGIGYSVNPVEIISPQISSHFVGKEKEGKEQFGTFGRFYSVKYALIKTHGVINPTNILEYKDNEEIMKNFNKSESMLFECLWNGTNSLVTRSKYPQRSILYIEVTYDKLLFNDLHLLVNENEKMKGDGVEKLDAESFDFSEFLKALEARKKKVKSVKIAGCYELKTVIDKLKKDVSNIGIEVEILNVEQ